MWAKLYNRFMFEGIYNIYRVIHQSSSIMKRCSLLHIKLNELGFTHNINMFLKFFLGTKEKSYSILFFIYAPLRGSLNFELALLTYADSFRYFSDTFLALFLGKLLRFGYSSLDLSMVYSCRPLT